MAILNKYKKKWVTSLLLRKDKYYDFVLSHNNEKTVQLNGKLTERCLISYIDTNKKDCIIDNSLLFSDKKYTYANAVNDNLELKNIGFTGIDTSTVPYDIESGNTDEFSDVIQNTSLQIIDKDTRLQLVPVTGNTKQYDYPCELVEEDSGDTYYKFNGGFLQGFYKTCDGKYEVLPQYINGAWNLEFVIRPRTDYVHTGNTLNDIYPDNSGIFFYMGTRAENKFAEHYGDENLSKFQLRNTNIGSTSGYADNKLPLLTTSDGHIATSNEDNDIVSNNGYLIYNRTCDGHTVDTWNRGDSIKITLQKRNYNRNLYTIMDRTCSGYTVQKLEKEIKEQQNNVLNNDYDVLKDLYGNAFALKVNEDWSFGYKYLVKDCESETGYSVKEENGFPGAISANEWNVINVMFKILNGVTDKCGVPFGERKMKIYIYVNGYLKFVSEELPELNFKELNEYCDKQEGVAFNISLGGGTQGLIESIWPGNTAGSKHIFPIEQNFAGSFIGDIRSFKFYDCQLQYNEIKNNYLYENIVNSEDKDMIKNNFIYYGFGTSLSDFAKKSKTKKANSDIRTKFQDTCASEDSRFYVVISKKYIGRSPYQFTCGGAPVVMIEEGATIGGVSCIVYKTAEVYTAGTELMIVSDNE